MGFLEHLKTLPNTWQSFPEKGIVAPKFGNFYGLRLYAPRR